ncbi:hypothetical protein [Nocardia macrotermitis]|uniref:Uncharacterized protein n=1 Tax=Nocardia macrotermitis TaxID=2585198 RepID=A0A7K0CZG0_9NOCA|nr:hypothetical protein [Nocardia macrotermitis]MQY18848.1 hypothetical protein [Nocardia macrotermitis]
MVAHISGSRDQALDEVYSVAGWRAHSRKHLLRYRLAVVASDAAAAVRHVGGWIYDRTMAGWEVTAMLADTSDVRPLRILGAVVLDLEDSLASPVHDIWPHAVAVAPEMIESDPRVRQGVLDSLQQRRTEIALWGAQLPADLDGRLEPAHHRLSTAARAFKGVALAAAGEPEGEVSGVETFHCGELLLTGLWGGADLTRTA